MKPGQIIVLTGAGGGLGSLAIQYANVMGMRVVAVDHGSKEEHCKSLGAEWFVDAFKTENIVEHIVGITDGGPHGVINFAAAKKPMEEALQYVRKKGTVVFVGLPKDATVSNGSSESSQKRKRLQNTAVKCYLPDPPQHLPSDLQRCHYQRIGCWLSPGRRRSHGVCEPWKSESSD